jgi:hypothetical protein
MNSPYGRIVERMAMSSKSRLRGRSPIASLPVREVFDAFPPKLRERLYALRQLILDTAEKTPGVGELTEALKWNEPAYLTAASNSGSTIRLNGKGESGTKYSLLFNCNTTLVDSFRTLFPKTFRYIGNREIEFDVADKIAKRELQICISMALTYHLKKK